MVFVATVTPMWAVSWAYQRFFTVRLLCCGQAQSSQSASRIRTRLSNPPQGPIQLTLACLRRRSSLGGSRSGQTGRTGHVVRSDLLWQEGRLVPAERLERTPRGLTIPVKLHIPSGPEGADSWEIKIERHR